MKTISVLKKDIEFNNGLTSLIDTLKTIAVSQYRALEQRIKSYEELIPAVDSFFGFIDIQNVNHPFLNPQGKAQAVVAVTSDSGLIGGLNMQIVFAAIRELEKVPGRLVVVGECGKMYARDFGQQFTAFPGIIEEERRGQAMQLRDYLTSKVTDGAFGQLKIIYPRPVSFTVQRVETIQLLPYLPSKKSGSGVAGEPFSGVIMESSQADMAAYLVYIRMAQVLYEIFGFSRLAEFAARFVHLEESIQRLKDLDRKLRLQYFRARHELIDRNMRELFAARSLYAK